MYTLQSLPPVHTTAKPLSFSLPAAPPSYKALFFPAPWLAEKNPTAAVWCFLSPGHHPQNLEELQDRFQHDLGVEGTSNEFQLIYDIYDIYGNLMTKNWLRMTEVF